MVTAALIARASAGDNDAFRDLTEPYRRELKVHCYRMLGSLQDAEDALQDTLLTAWRSLGGFEGRASIRTWLYRIATSRCLNALRSASRRPAKAWDIPGVEPPEPSAFGEVAWLEPFPDALLAGAADVPPGPEARYEQREAISLAFVDALRQPRRRPAPGNRESTPATRRTFRPRRPHRASRASGDPTVRPACRARIGRGPYGACR